ncbi:MAG: PTS sugar transporter subunit IIA [Chlamydiae bacterium]|jgi:PTS system nitrogen regulatory IIA component|nr:PTS sugar transporter subunit IIA [Chlamydiota bacterium]
METIETSIFAAVDEKSIHFIPSCSRNVALEVMVTTQNHEKILGKEGNFLKAILAREELVSTGIGFACAIPHAKLHDIDDFFIKIGIVQGAGIDWKSVDRTPVKLIFMIGGPAIEPNRYLKILSTITEAIRKEEFRKELLSCVTAKEVLKLFERI